MMPRKKVAVIITEYWDISHADVFITKMMEGFAVNGVRYRSTLDIVSMYVDQFPERDISRGLAAKHGIPMYGTIEEALRCGGSAFTLDGIIIIGEHGEYGKNEYGQILYPRRQFFELCLNVMLEHQRIVPVFSDKGFAIVQEDIEWVYEQVNKHHIPFMSSSSIPFAFQHPHPLQIPSGAPLHRMFGFIYGDLERYAYHTIEMLQSIAERRACGENGVEAVTAYTGERALELLLSEEWGKLYRTLAGYANVTDVETFPHTLTRPVFVDVRYKDGLHGGMLFADKEINQFVSAYQIYEDDHPYCTQFHCQWQKPYVHSAIFVLEIERFIHSGRPSFPVERSLITTGVTDAIMRSVHFNKTIETPYLSVRY
ncbi:MAG: hypothetical protein K0Q59_3280 [Paenibacillus sp.]|nr:hypothetical protein [Paenibacillus sp.]